MKKLAQLVKPIASMSMIAFVIATSSIVVTASIAGATELESSREDNPKIKIIEQKREKTDDSKDYTRLQQRQALEMKKQELRATKEEAETKLKAQHEAKQEKLSASKLEICKERETNINNRISRIADRSTKHLELFTTIAERTQNFYTNSGTTLANYDELAADVAAKKTAAESAVVAMKSMNASFACDGNDPKLTIEVFKTNLQGAIDILKEYRTSVKNLIVGVKSANSTLTTDDSAQTGRKQ
ncbi:MAG TPA: hypothetical protein VGO98_02715 [Candidatus Saccharimonadales bacterium]|jgi:hypothetical protein|nr:hypothetical protein [Candidatus Saccharimonadales bacterium]